MSRRVLFVMAELTHSGAETMLRAIGPALRRCDIDAHIMSTGECGEGAFSDDLRAAGYQIHHVAFRRDLRFFRQCWRLFRRQRFDIIHIHCERANFWLGLLARLAGARAFRTVHGLFAFRGTLRLRRRVQRWLSRCTGVVFTAPSAVVQTNERERFGNPCRRLDNWVDESRFAWIVPAERQEARARFGLTPDQFALVSVGSCQYFKNHRAVIAALALLPVHVVYLHVGGGELLGAEEDFAHNLGVAERIFWLGPRDDVRTVLAAADLFVMPSLFEAQGLAAVEALMSGVACLFNRIDSLIELADFDGEGGWCDSDPASIAAGVGRALRDGGRRARPDAAAALRRQFGCDRAVRNLLQLWENG